MIGQPPTRKPRITANQGRRLQKFWQGMRAQAKDRALRTVRTEMSQIIKPSGELRSVASKVGGDLSGLLQSALVIAIRGIRISTIPPSDGQTLVYDAALNRLVYNGVRDLGRWEPLTNGDPDAPELLFTADGDVLMGFVED